MFLKNALTRIIRMPYLIFFTVIALGAVFSISVTSIWEATQSDAIDYLRLAETIVSQKPNIIEIFTLKSFIDIGYPIVLSLLMSIFGNRIIVFQIFNYLCWFLATVLIYKTLVIATNGKRAFLGSVVMAISPVFISFSAYIYSEAFSALGAAIIIYSIVKYKTSKSYWNLIGAFIGAAIFFFTRSLYSLLIIPIVYFLSTHKNRRENVLIALAVVLALARLYFSYLGGRSNYNLVIQSARVYQSYTTLGKCSLYNLSYPLGKYVFPESELSCMKKYPSEYANIPSDNPFYLAGKLRGTFDIGDWFGIVISNPPKYLFVVATGLTGLVFIEGYYGNVTSYFNSALAMGFFAIVKLLFAYYIWSGIFRNFRNFLKWGRGKALLSVIPLVYFVLIVGNFLVEQRWFYPLLPWVYFYAALDKKGIKYIIGSFRTK